MTRMPLTACGHHREAIVELARRAGGRLIPATGGSCSIGDCIPAPCLADWICIDRRFAPGVPRAVADERARHVVAKHLDQEQVVGAARSRFDLIRWAGSARESWDLIISALTDRSSADLVDGLVGHGRRRAAGRRGAP
jgi:hypothetical protein